MTLLLAVLVLYARAIAAVTMLAALALAIAITAGSWSSAGTLPAGRSPQGPAVRATAADLRDDLEALHPQAPASEAPAASDVRAAPIARATSERAGSNGPTGLGAAVRSEVLDLPALVRAAAREFGADVKVMYTLASCESTWRPHVVGRAQEIGLYQWKPRTWEWLAELSGLGYDIRHIVEPEAQARLTAWAMANGYAHHWTCWRDMQEVVSP